jgi:hypothetical protein
MRFADIPLLGDDEPYVDTFVDTIFAPEDTSKQDIVSIQGTLHQRHTMLDGTFVFTMHGFTEADANGERAVIGYRFFTNPQIAKEILANVGKRIWVSAQLRNGGPDRNVLAIEFYCLF